jgi:hypothetical protein
MKGKAKGPGMLLLRLLGLTGALAAVFGGVLLAAYGGPWAWLLLLAGLADVGVWLAAEVLGSISLVSGRGAMGANVAGQILLAVLLFVGINVFSFQHYKRLDCTADHRFTLSETIKSQLAKLEDETDIVVLQTGVSFGQRAENRADKADKYDVAAQKQIVEKVHDLVQMFQDLGARFRVKILDSTSEQYEAQLRPMRGDAKYKVLVEAIDATSENSIFIHSRGKVQRLGFQDVYQVDKEASRKQGNLVLNYQGEQPLANKIFNIEARKPRIAVGVVHPSLGLDAFEDSKHGMVGLKRVLEQRGFEYREIVLKHKWRREPPQGRLAANATAMEYKENRFQELDNRIKLEEMRLKVVERNIKTIKAEIDKWRDTPLKDLQAEFVMARSITGGYIPKSRQEISDFERRVGAKVAQRELLEVDRTPIVEELKEELKEEEINRARFQTTKQRAEEERSKLDAQAEQIAESQRIELRAKMDRILADCDMLLLPRPTYFDVLNEDIIPPMVYSLEQDQVDGIKAFIKSGKPVLFCLGPTVDPDEPGPGKTEIEDLLKDFGFHLNNQVVLYNAEGDAFEQRQDSDGLFKVKRAEIPPTELAWSTSPAEGEEPYRKNEISTSLSITARALGEKASRELLIRQPRPVYVYKIDPKTGQRKQYKNADLLVTNAQSWNEEQPFVVGNRVPQYQKPAKDDPRNNTFDEKRRGPFPIAAVVDERVPLNWYSASELYAKPSRVASLVGLGVLTPVSLTVEERVAAETVVPMVRLGVIGHGGIFNGERINPMKEKIFLDVSNWLLGREDLLSKERSTWSFPRVQLVAAPNEAQLAKETPQQRAEREEKEARQFRQAFLVRGLSAWVLLPALCVFAGVVVWLVRRVR